jgi:hypothetical protein
MNASIVLIVSTAAAKNLLSIAFLMASAAFSTFVRSSSIRTTTLV